ncbi:MAG: FAD-dependent oxidoreductase [Clostridia bacterium]|jgi:hypothetical protein
MYQVVVIGGGWAGCAAALQAAKSGARTVLLERTDMLLGTGLVGGIMRNNGRYTAAEEMIAMGGGELFALCDANTRHFNVDFPGHRHASLYDIGKISGAVEKKLLEAGVDIFFRCRIEKAMMEGHRLTKVRSDKGEEFEGSVFVDASGSAGPMRNCTVHGNGCVMCIYRCPSFGGRVSVAGLAGVAERTGKRGDGKSGAMSGSCKLYKESLSREIQLELNEKGVVVIPIPKDLGWEVDLSLKACQQYTLEDFHDNIILLDTGHAKLMSPYFPLHLLKKIPGFEHARYEDPYAGGIGNSIRFLALCPRDNTLKVEGVDNLFCAGEKAGLLVGHTEAICTGVLAGYNSSRYVKGQEGISLPVTTAVGDAIAFVKEQMETEEGLMKKFTFSGSVYFERMNEKGFYTTDKERIRERVKAAGCEGLFDYMVFL